MSNSSIETVGGGCVGVEAFREAAARIAPHVARTPLVRMARSGVLLKAENLQPTGAFKLRGAFNVILSLTDAQRARGVVAHSSGNHAQAVAYAAHKLGVRSVVVMPSDAPKVKVDATRYWGAEIVFAGTASSERSAVADSLAREHGYSLVPPYDSLQIIAATATIALEILEQCPQLSVILAPLSGGGLMAGIAAATKSLKSSVRVIGVEPEVAADAYESMRAGTIVTLPAEQMARTLADGLRVQRLGATTWPFIRAHVDEVVTVSEAAIRHAVRDIANETRLIAEPSGATSVAAALELGAVSGEVVAVLTGGNVDAQLFASLLGGSD